MFFSNEKKTIIFLKDNFINSLNIKILKKEFEKKFNQFYQDNFNNSGKENINFSIQIICINSIDIFKNLLFEHKKTPLKYAKCLLFIIDDFFTDISSKRNQIDKMNFLEWLDIKFPTIPRIILKKINLNLDNSTYIHQKYYVKYFYQEELNNPQEFCYKIYKYFIEWWSPVYWNALYQYTTQTHITSWHTPGHNLGNAFLQSAFQKDFYQAYGDLIFRTDLSVSVESLGDLSEPNFQSPLSDSQKRSAKIFGAEETFYVTGGTSTANKALLMTLLKPGDVVLLERNCHKSVHQAIVMCGALPIYLPTAFNETLGVWTPVMWETIRRYLTASYSDAIKPKMLILTTCTYEGVLYPINNIAQLCERKGILFYADEAWAPYLRFHPYYIQTQLNGQASRYNATDGGAHFAVQSTHKTLAAFSQASMLHISPNFYKLLELCNPDWNWLQERFSFNNKGSHKMFRHNLLEVLRYWHSTSPYYPILATLDRVGIQMQLEGMQKLEERMRWVEEFIEEAESIAPDCILGLRDIVGRDYRKYFPGYAKDPLKLLIGFKNAVAGELFRKSLKASGIQWEKSSSQCIEFLVTIGTTIDNFKQLIHLLKQNRHLLGCNTSNNYCDLNHALIKGQIKISPRSAALCDGELVDLSHSEGRICAQMIVPFPPGIPIFIPGLRVTSQMIDRVYYALNINKDSVHGISEDSEKYFIKVMKRSEEQKTSQKDIDCMEQIQKITNNIDMEIQLQLQEKSLYLHF